MQFIEEQDEIGGYLSHMRTVFFDLFETLVTENHPEWFGHPSLAQRLGIGEELCRREWRARYEERMTGAISDHGTVLREICIAAGIRPPEQEIQRLVEERIEAKARPFLRVDVGIVEMLEELRRRRLQVGVITNCTCEEAAAWASSPLASLVDVAIFSYEVGVIKPQPEIYTFACNRLKAVPEDACFVGDGGSDELRGAQAVGLHPIWATWFIEAWPFDWIGHVAATAGQYPRCGSVADLPSLIGNQ